MGDPIENEHGTAASCDTEQQTTTGLAYWACSSQVLGFVLVPDGQQHWALVGGQMVQWTGPSRTPPSADVTPSADVVTEIPLDAPCLEPHDSAANACVLYPGPDALGVLHFPGDTFAYWFVVPQGTSSVYAELTDLPADYDLYVVNSTGDILGQSVQEGTTTETVDATLPPGVYYLYVHADEGRDVNPDLPYRLHLALASGPAVAEVPATEVSYVVQPRDSLRSIAANYGVDISSILDVNQIANPESLTVGEVLRIPGAAP